MRTRFLGIVAAILTTTTVVFAQDPGTECPLYGPTYRLQSDTVVWRMTLASGQSCIRGLRSAFSTLDNIKLITAPTAGNITLEGPGFVYKTDSDFRGNDTFVFSVSGKSYGLSGSSIIQVSVAVR
jgi:hypothetical protein